MRELTLEKESRGDQARYSSQKAIAYFEEHAEYYEKSQYRTTRRTFINSRHEQILNMLDALVIPEGASVLDAGCGPGNLVPQFAARYSRVCALDASPRMVTIARSNVRGASNVVYQVGSIEALPFADETFDMVCSAGVIEYLPNINRALTEMCRVLQPGGLLILPTTNALSPAHWFRPMLERIARVPSVSRVFGIRPGDFELFYHRIPEFKDCLRSAGLVIERERHFYLTLPRPLDRVFPSVARLVERQLDKRMDTGLRHLAEGYIAVARKSRALIM